MDARTCLSTVETLTDEALITARSRLSRRGGDGQRAVGDLHQPVGVDDSPSGR
ncbi:non-ribosomal peptide synthetase domain protein [Mycobacterium xenopi 4042]|uniref:Non-ribosomal peptide synthetase domain protein n=1 Tax=Mycobacterium xenopi 4042 TaxID=1299334 RepID=X8CNQ4_MYCXE|nr:non-ribosomal peptide synthetase domain protein [Mycobacterium xenopi 4042]